MRSTHRDYDRQPQQGDSRVLRERQTLGGTIEDEIAERLAERAIGFLEHRARCGKFLGKRLAHADGLRSLSRKEECNHPSTRIRSLRAG